MTTYVALLRGINVGGNNLIKMTALKACFEKHGLENVATFIQSGNVLFGSDTPAKDLATELEALLGKTFGYAASVVLRRHKQMRAIVAGAPKGFDSPPGKYRCDVIFFKDPRKVAAAIEEIPTREGVDIATAGNGVMYFSRLDARASQSRLSRIMGLPIYKEVTIRNWNTTRKLLALMDAR